MIILTIFGLLLVLLMIGLPIFAAMVLASSIVLSVLEGKAGAVADAAFASLNNPTLATIPMFALMAHVMIKGKVVDDLFDMANRLVGHVSGGLSLATILSCTVFAAISGSSVATALTIGSTAIPQMKRFGYPPRDAYGIIAAGGTLGILIPPSGPMILFSVVSNASIGALFIAGVIPGLMLAGIFAIYSWAKARRDGLRSPAFVGWGGVWEGVKGSFWAMMMPPVVLGGIYFGVFTATEAAAVGALYALFVAGIVYRGLTWQTLGECLWETMRTTAMLFMIIAAAGIFGHVITIARIPAQVMEWVTTLGLGQTGFIFMVMAALFVLGMFLETIAIILITTPIILPTMVALNINPVWYGVLLMINLELALITPPVGMNLFVIKAIENASMGQIIRGSAPYVLLMILGMLIVWAFPPLATWLPEAAGFGTGF